MSCTGRLPRVGSARDPDAEPAGAAAYGPHDSLSRCPRLAASLQTPARNSTGRKLPPQGTHKNGFRLALVVSVPKRTRVPKNGGGVAPRTRSPGWGGSDRPNRAAQVLSRRLLDTGSLRDAPVEPHLLACLLLEARRCGFSIQPPPMWNAPVREARNTRRVSRAWILRAKVCENRGWLACVPSLLLAAALVRVVSRDAASLWLAERTSRDGPLRQGLPNWARRGKCACVRLTAVDPRR